MPSPSGVDFETQMAWVLVKSTKYESDVALSTTGGAPGFPSCANELAYCHSFRGALANATRSSESPVIAATPFGASVAGAAPGAATRSAPADVRYTAVPVDVRCPSTTFASSVRGGPSDCTS